VDLCFTSELMVQIQQKRGMGVEPPVQEATTKEDVATSPTRKDTTFRYWRQNSYIWRQNMCGAEIQVFAKFEKMIFCKNSLKTPTSGRLLAGFYTEHHIYIYIYIYVYI